MSTQKHGESPAGEEPSIQILSVSGGVWTTQPVTEQPKLTLSSWSVNQLLNGDRHFVGWCIENREGRVSSKIEIFDAVTLRGITQSGRVYPLNGRPGHNSDADYVWKRWARINSVNEFIDVSAEVFGYHKACQRPL